MNITIRKKLIILIGTLLILFLSVGLTAFRGLNMVNTYMQKVITIHEPIISAAYEMDVSLLRTGFGLLGYLQNRSQEQLERFHAGRKDFVRFQQQYEQLAETDEERSVSLQSKELFLQFEKLGNELIFGSDEQHQQLETLRTLIDRRETFIDKTFSSSIQTETDLHLANQKLSMLAGMEADLADSQRFLENYIHTGAPEYETRIQDAWQRFEEHFKKYSILQLPPQEQQGIYQLYTFFGETQSLSNDILRLKKQKDTQIEQFLELREHIGADLLYQKMIKEFAEKNLQSAGKRVTQMAAGTNRNILLLLVFGTIFGIVFGAILSQGITKPLSQLVKASSQLSIGDLAVNIRVKTKDELAVLATAFEKMVRYIKKVASVTETIAEGDLRVDVKLQSEQDVLNASLQKMVHYIQDVAEVTEKVSNKDLQVEVSPKSGQDLLNLSLQQMVKNLDAMITEGRRQNWLKDGVSQLGKQLSGDNTLTEVCQKAINFTARYLHAGQGAIYTYDENDEVLKLQAAFAFTERNALSNSYTIGQGVVGQVALERAPILLKHPPREQATITTGTVSRAPLHTYTFPLIYDNNLYGVIELASPEGFDEYAQNFLQEVNQVIATVLFSTAQRDRVKILLEMSQQAAEAAETAAKESEIAQKDAQRKAEEVQQANTQLEEQQQQLEQQSEELQQVNTHLKEQQQQLQQQSEELRQQNESLNKTKEELDQRARDLELASKYKSEFLANMSHELRTPLNSIILLSKMLSRNEKQNLDTKEIKEAKVIHQAGEELLRLINDILDLSKIEAGKVTVNLMEFSIKELFGSFQDLFRSVAEEKGLQFIITEDFDAILNTDRDKLAQVIRNLLANAFKFTREGSVTLAASLAPDHKNSISITVSDTGIGIPKEQQKLVFEAFQQADGSTSREFGGTGLGLSIAREYTKLLGGALSLESEADKGSTFTIILPTFLQELPSHSKREEAERKLKAETPKPVPLPPMTAQQTPLSALTEVIDDRDNLSPSDKIILIIEDNADLAQNTMDVTKEMGFKVLVALKGQEGLALAAQYRPTGILLDLVLPDINGMEVLRELKSTRELRHIPVHIMSSKERSNSYRYNGAVGYFQKPLNDIDIQNAVDNLMTVSEKYPKQLLIVEDDETQREALKELLGNSDGVEITGVSTQEEAITEIKQGGYDAAIIDLGLKDGSGYEICHYIQERGIVLPVIIYTGRELSEEEERQLRKYTDSIIIKTAKSYERLSDEAALFLHQMYHGESPEGSKVKAAPPKALESQDSLKGKKILIVDDDVKNVFVLASALENHGAIVVDAKNGQIALEQLQQEPDIDLVLMDIMMPVMDGYTAIREIRKDEKLKHLPIIALTAKALKGDRQKCIQAGANDYLSKPVDYDGLIRLAKAWIDKN